MKSPDGVIAEYELLSAPRFDAENFDARLFDSAIGQRAFWNHVSLHLVRSFGTSAELRISHLERTRISLRLHGIPDDATMAQIAQAEAMLPSGFRWRKVEPEGRIDALQLRIARVVRRLEFVDLPVPSPDVQRAAAAGETPVFDLAPSTDGLRFLPRLDTDFAELLTERFCLPLPGPLDEYRPRAKSLFQAIQASSPLVLSITLHPVDPFEHEENQIKALGWKRFLDMFVGHLASAGFASVQSLRSAYDRFSLPRGHLCRASIRVGGTDHGSVVGLANVVASQFGGFQGFHVIQPRRLIDGRALADPDIDSPAAWSDAQRQRQYERLAGDMREAGVSADEAAEAFDFLMRLPHLFSLGEAHDLIRLPFADDEGLPGFDTEPVPPFTVPSLDFVPAVGSDGGLAAAPPGRVRLGVIDRPGAPLSHGDQPLANVAWHAIQPADLTKHALIVGGTGSGKTTVTLFILRELIRLRIPFLVIEPVKTEYYDRLKTIIPKIRRRNFEGAPTGGPGKDFLAFDPLRVPKGISVARHASYLKSCFEAAFPMEPVTAMLVEKALIEYYTGPRKDGCCGFGKFERGGAHLGSIRADGSVFPSYASFKAFITGLFVDREFSTPTGGQNRANEIRDIFRRRFENLSLGILGTSFELADGAYRYHYRKNGNRPDPRYYDLLGSDLLTWPTVIELDAIPDADQKALAMAFLMTYIFELRQAEDLLAREAGQPLAEALRHFLIVEEAHRLLANNIATSRGGEQVGDSARGKSVGLFVDMLAEIRAFGQGLAIVEQIPSKIVPEAIKNTSLKIMLRLAARDDRDSLGAAMNFTEAQKRYVTLLKVDRPRDDIAGRVNFVLFEESLEQPLLLNLPLSGARAPGTRPFDEFFQGD